MAKYFMELVEYYKNDKADFAQFRDGDCVVTSKKPDGTVHRIRLFKRRADALEAFSKEIL